MSERVNIAVLREHADIYREGGLPFVAEEMHALCDEVERLRDGLRDAADRISDDSEHCRMHDLATCGVVSCVAKRVLAGGKP